MTKKYENPILQVVGINKKDIIATSTRTLGFGDPGSANNAEAPGQRGLDDWDAGY